MNNSMSLSVDEKKRLWIFVAIAFGIPLLMSVPMYLAFKRGIDLDISLPLKCIILHVE